MSEAWILVGMMGSGKSTIGRRLAELANRPFFDTDLMLQNRIGRSISQMFKVYGEEAFRDHETSLLKSIKRGESVISTGGGVVLKPENWIELNRLGKTVFIDVPLETLYQRLGVSRKKRPLLESDDWKEKLEAILLARDALYRKADLIFPLTGLEMEEVVTQLHDKLSETA